MKKVLPFIFLFLVIASVVAQVDAYQVHLGTKNKYPIGNKDITAKVYLQFLKEKATGEEYSYWHFSKYWEYSFMDMKRFSIDIPSSINNCIEQTTAWSPERKCYYYDYSLISPEHVDYYDYGYDYGGSLIRRYVCDHEDYIIDALSSKEVQHEFNGWYADWLKNRNYSSPSPEGDE